MRNLIHNISDTALWAAMFRADECDRPDALFRDPFARRLAGERGKEITDKMPSGRKHAWSWVSRTFTFDQFIADEVRQGADLVVNLAAGLDTRPYRMSLPANLTWVEVDLPPILEYKTEILAREKPVCTLERVPLDLADAPGRRELFERIGAGAKRAIIVTEGLLIYLDSSEVSALARDLAAPSSFHRWALDLTSPGLLRILQKNIGTSLDAGGAPLKFGPPEGPSFFEPQGWRPEQVRGLLKVAAKLKRLPLLLRLFAMLPEPKGRAGNRPWGGVCLMAKIEASSSTR